MFNWYLILKDKSLQILVKLEATYLIHISNSFEDYIPNREKNNQKKNNPNIKIRQHNRGLPFVLKTQQFDL